MNRTTLAWPVSLFLLAAAAAFGQAEAPPPDSAGATTRPAFGGDKFPLPLGDDVAAALEQGPGRLAIRAVQGTPGGPPIGAAGVTVQLLHQGMVIETREDQLDEHGVLVLEDLPVAMGAVPVVLVEHAGVTYRQSGPMMTSAAPEQMVEVVCYEVTDEAPDWSIQMRHVMVAQASEGLTVNEIIVLENPGQRTWLGSPQADGRKQTTRFPLTRGAADVKLGRGFHDWCCTTFTGGTVVNHLPLMPGRTEMSMQYTVPWDGAEAAIDLVAPVTAGHLMVIVPEEIRPLGYLGLDPAGTSTVAGKNVRFFAASDVTAETQAAIILSRQDRAVLATPAPGSDAAPRSMAKVIAAIGGGVLVLAAIVILLARSPRTATAPALRPDARP